MADDFHFKDNDSSPTAAVSEEEEEEEEKEKEKEECLQGEENSPRRYGEPSENSSSWILHARDDVRLENYSSSQKDAADPANFEGPVQDKPNLNLNRTNASSPRGVPTPGSSTSNDNLAIETAAEAYETIGAAKELNEMNRSAESVSRLSRIDGKKMDVKNLKSATLGRMGKIFKIRPPTPAGREKSTNNSDRESHELVVTAGEEQYGPDPTRKDKTHSLGRMLRLVDKDGAPRKLFAHSRTGSLTRLRKTNPTVGKDESRNIFTRMINQLKGRNPSSANAEPNLQASVNSAKPSLGTRLMMSLSARGHHPTAAATTDASGPEASVEQVAV